MGRLRKVVPARYCEGCHRLLERAPSHSLASFARVRFHPGCQYHSLTLMAARARARWGDEATNAWHAKAIEMRRAGSTLSVIAKTVGRSMARVSTVLTQAGVTTPNGRPSPPPWRRRAGASPWWSEAVAMVDAGVPIAAVARAMRKTPPTIR